MTPLALVALLVFAVLVAVMNVTTALFESSRVVADVGKRVLSNLWARGEART